MLLALWSPKGGSGTSVLAAACSIVLARGPGGRLADLAGDQPAILGLAADPDSGLSDWLAAGPEAPSEALARLGVEAAPGLTLLPQGGSGRVLGPVAAAEAGAALGVALRDGPVTTVADLGTASTPATRALLEVSDASIVVVRPCYLALRRAVRAPLLPRAMGVALLEETGRSLTAVEVSDVLDRPVVARVPARVQIARVVDAGVLGSRLPESLARAAGQVLAAAGLGGRRRGAAA